MYIPAKKSLGQNFLTSQAALHEIAEAALISPGETILEVGPGKGVLTEVLLACGANVIAVEKDRRLIPFLSEKFVSAVATGKLKIIEADILELSKKEIGLTDHQYKVVANIPYYITGIFIRTFLETDIQPSHMVILVQKEVAERIVARDGKESILSISVKAYGIPKLISTVKAGSFQPAPKVDSAILQIGSISRNFFTEFSESVFFEILKKGFAHKRKVLVQNLELKDEDRARAVSLFGNEKIRAEDITTEQWGKLVEILTTKK